MHPLLQPPAPKPAEIPSRRRASRAVVHLAQTAKVNDLYNEDWVRPLCFDQEPTRTESVRLGTVHHLALSLPDVSCSRCRDAYKRDAVRRKIERITRSYINL